MTRSNFGIIRPSIDLRVMVEAALWNVDYHLSVLKTVLMSRGMSTHWQDDPAVDDAAKRNLQGEVNRFHAHLRAFFWELVAAYDVMRRWVKGDASKLTYLEHARNSDWYTEVSNYRNHAHESFLVAEGVYKTRDGKRCAPVMLIRGRRNGNQVPVPDGLFVYRDNMHKLFQDLC